jgi:formylglycine-generating enzyme required for sulfatase activity
VEPSTDGKGVFIRLNANGFGTQTGTALLKFAASIPAFATTNFHVFGIEMVWIPQATFQVGDGSVNHTAGTGSAYNYGSPVNTTAPYTISSEAAIAAGTLQNTKGASNCNTPATYNVPYNPLLSASFPKGYAGFYCMKYEISQQQYVAFLNDLSLAQQGSRVVAPPSSAIGTFAMTGGVVAVNRNSIVVKTPAAAGAPAVFDNDLDANLVYGDGGDIACNYLSWDDLLAYLDWSALRPMTELEYEKICRGTDPPIVREYPWHNTTLTIASSAAINFGGTSNEVSTATGNGLCCFGAGGTGPLRCGFAATAVSGRTDAGASFYGVLDMGGNVWEQCINTGWRWYTVACSGIPTDYPVGGVIYTGVLGDGTLDATGNADAANWGNSRYSIIKGGSWNTANSAAGLQLVQVSDRTSIFNLGSYPNNSRDMAIGGRGVRKP